MKMLSRMKPLILLELAERRDQAHSCCLSSRSQGLSKPAPGPAVNTAWMIPKSVDSTALESLILLEPAERRGQAHSCRFPS